MTEEELYNGMVNDIVAFFKTIRTIAVGYGMEQLAIHCIDEMWFHVRWKYKSNDPTMKRTKAIFRLVGGWARFQIVMQMEGLKDNYDVDFDGSVN
jgi:hypothetical protein